MPQDNYTAADVWNRYAWLRDNGHLDYVDKAEKCENFFAGFQWEKNDLALLRKQKRPALTINKIISTISNVLGEQIFNRTSIAFRPRNEGATGEVADALTKVFMQVSDNNQLDWLRSDVFCDGIIGSRGFFDVRLDFTDSAKGEVRIEQLNPKNVLIDADADEYDPDKWGDVIVTKWMSADQIALLYSEKDADMLRNRTESYFPYGYDSIDSNRDRFGSKVVSTYGIGTDYDTANVRNIRVIERQWRKLDMARHFVDLASGDMRVIPAEWDEARIAQHMEANPDTAITKKLTHRIRWTVIADNIVLHDDWSPYQHFTVVPYFPYFRRGTTLGLVENLLGPQELLNKVSSQELHVVNTTANSGWKVKRNALQNMSTGELEQRGAETGLVLEVDELDNVEKILPNQTPTGLDRITYKAEEHIKTISGVSDYMSGFAREDVAAKSVNANKQSGQANLAKVMDNMNRTDFILARNILDLIQTFYTEERLIFITADRITNAVEQIYVNQVTPEGTIINDLTLGEYSIVVTNQPERDTFEDSQFDQAVRLRMEAGIAIPDKYIIQSSRLRDKEEIIKDMTGDQDSPEAQEQAEMKRRAQLAELAKLEAEAQETGAEAGLKTARADKERVLIQKEIQELNEGAAMPMSEEQRELLKMESELQIQRERMDGELDLKRREMEETIKLKRESMIEEMKLKREKQQQDSMTNRVVAVEKARQTSRQPTTTS